MALPVSFRWDEEFVRRIDEARGDVPRSKFVRRAVEQALGREVVVLADSDAPSPAPAEQPRARIDREVERAVDEAFDAADREAQGVVYAGRVRSSAAARPFRPAPKKG